MTLRERYAQPWRHFHTWDHVQRLMRAAEWFYAPYVVPQSVRDAILYHDAVYIPGATDNEEKSAELYDAEEPKAIIWWRKTIQDYILATKFHRTINTTSHKAVFLSCDLVSLAAPWPQFCLDSQNVCKEYAYAYDAEKVRAGRKAFYESMLARATIYPHPYFQRTHERRARLNMEQALRGQL